MRIRNEIWQVVELLTNWPTGIGISFRSVIYPMFLKRFPLAVSKRRIIKIYPGVHISAPGSISIGSGTSIQRNCQFMSEGGITIGQDVMVAPACIFMTHQHTFKVIGRPIYDQPIKKEAICIEDDVWVGSGSLILPGVTIGHGAIIGAGSVVSADIPAMEIWVGNPARKLRERA